MSIRVKVLLVEDYGEMRIEIKKALENYFKPSLEVLAPNSFDEVVKSLKEGSMDAVLADNNLKYWENPTDPGLKFSEKKVVRNGVEFANQLAKIESNLPLGVYTNDNRKMEQLLDSVLRFDKDFTQEEAPAKRFRPLIEKAFEFGRKKRNEWLLQKSHFFSIILSENIFTSRRINYVEFTYIFKEIIKLRDKRSFYITVGNKSLKVYLEGKIDAYQKELVINKYINKEDFRLSLCEFVFEDLLLIEFGVYDLNQLDVLLQKSVDKNLTNKTILAYNVVISEHLFDLFLNDNNMGLDKLMKLSESLNQYGKFNLVSNLWELMIYKYDMNLVNRNLSKFYKRGYSLPIVNIFYCTLVSIQREKDKCLISMYSVKKIDFKVVKKVKYSYLKNKSIIALGACFKWYITETAKNNYSLNPMAASQHFIEPINSKEFRIIING